MQANASKTSLEPESANAEARRFAALRSLGIDVWLPRQPLTGCVGEHTVYAPADKRVASPSVAPSNKPDVGDSRAAGFVSSMKASLESSTDAPAHKTAQKKPPESAHRARSQNQQAIAQARALEWLCLFYKDWLFVDDVTDVNVVRSAYTDWMQALLFALGLNQDELAQTGSTVQAGNPELPVRRIKWPPTRDLAQSMVTAKGHGAQSQEALSDKAKQEYVEAWFERQRGLLGREVRHVVLMGAQTQMIIKDQLEKTKPINREFFVLGEEVLSSAAEGSNKAPKGFTMFEGASILLAPSSQTLWSEPLKKQLFWSALRQLKQASIKNA